MRILGYTLALMLLVSPCAAQEPLQGRVEVTFSTVAEEAILSKSNARGLVSSTKQKKGKRMIKVIHELSKLAAIIWTALCGIAGAIFIISGFVVSADPETAGVGIFTSAAMLFIVGISWFFPTLCAVIAMYFTRPQAWEENKKQIAA